MLSLVKFEAGCTGACAQGRKLCSCPLSMPPVSLDTPPMAAEAATEAQASGWGLPDRRMSSETQDAELRGFELGQQIGYTQGWHWGLICGLCVSIVVACTSMAVRGWFFS